MNALDRARLEAVMRRLDRIEEQIGEMVRLERRQVALIAAVVELEAQDREPAPRPGERRLHLVHDE